ncbi:hypothetical protein [Nocardia alba]|uniref:hypothetical protein n=1 Tax=Nocardia alba TaxID=225051 RepID=UPI000832E983|nr:hypothetical protein [Nocardia alba]
MSDDRVRVTATLIGALEGRGAEHDQSLRPRQASSGRSLSRGGMTSRSSRKTPLQSKWTYNY